METKKDGAAQPSMEGSQEDWEEAMENMMQQRMFINRILQQQGMTLESFTGGDDEQDHGHSHSGHSEHGHSHSAHSGHGHPHSAHSDHGHSHSGHSDHGHSHSGHSDHGHSHSTNSNHGHSQEQVEGEVSIDDFLAEFAGRKEMNEAMKQFGHLDLEGILARQVQSAHGPMISDMKSSDDEGVENSNDDDSDDDSDDDGDYVYEEVGEGEEEEEDSKGESEVEYLEEQEEFSIDQLLERYNSGLLLKRNELVTYSGPKTHFALDELYFAKESLGSIEEAGILQSEYEDQLVLRINEATHRIMVEWSLYTDEGEESVVTAISIPVDCVLVSLRESSSDKFKKLDKLLVIFRLTKLLPVDSFGAKNVGNEEMDFVQVGDWTPQDCASNAGILLFHGEKEVVLDFARRLCVAFPQFSSHIYEAEAYREPISEMEDSDDDDDDDDDVIKDLDEDINNSSSNSKSFVTEPKNVGADDDENDDDEYTILQKKFEPLPLSEEELLIELFEGLKPMSANEDISNVDKDPDFEEMLQNLAQLAPIGSEGDTIDEIPLDQLEKSTEWNNIGQDVDLDKIWDK